MNKRLMVLIVLSVIWTNYLYAGFFDGLKKVGEGVADVAGGVVDTTVNATTSTVQAVKQRTVFADPQPNVSVTEQTMPAAVPAPASTTVPFIAPTPQVTERKSPSAENHGDDELSANKHRQEKSHQQDVKTKRVEQEIGNSSEQQYKLATDYLNSEEFIKQLDVLAKLDVGGKRYGEDARRGVYEKIEVMDLGLTSTVSTDKISSLPEFCKNRGEMRMPDAGKFTEWKEVLQANIERERQYMTDKAVESSVIKVIEEELAPRCAEYNIAMEFAGKIYSFIRNDLGSHHPYVACEKALWRTTHFGHGNENGPDGIYSLYDLDGWKDDPVEGRKIFQSGQSKLTKEVGDQWIAHVREWLARNDALLSRLVGVGIKEKCSSFYDKAGATKKAPFNVYRGILFGSLIGDVYSEMERYAQNNGANSIEWRGEAIGQFLNGCSFNVTVKPHDIQFMFGSFAPDEVPVLAAMTMKFTQAAPSVNALVEKYGKMDGAKIERNSEVVKRVWPETEIGQFWKMVVTTLEAKVKQGGSPDGREALKKNVESILAAHSKAITRENVRIVIDGVTVDISEDPSTHTVSRVFFKDTLLTARLMELCKNQKEAAKKAEADAKSAAEKKAQSDSLNF